MKLQEQIHEYNATVSWDKADINRDSSTLKTEAACCSETSVEFQWSTRRYIPEHITLHNHRCESLKSYLKYFLIKMP
jgi:hypothetical protein